MRIALIGDLHGDLDLLVRCAESAARRGAAAAIQLGDLGFREDLLGAGRRWPRLALPVLAVCGNHEDHAFLANARRSGLAAAWAAHGLVYQPRGSTARLGGRRVLFIGGALHADRAQDADRGNLIGAQDLAAAQAAAAIHPPDLVASHACPAGIGIGMRGSPALATAVAQHIHAAGYDCGPASDCGEPALAELWRSLAHRPACWAFGHFHTSHAAEIGGTAFRAVPEAEPETLLWWDSTLGAFLD
jgi:predicted phosphodiesterase